MDSRPTSCPRGRRIAAGLAALAVLGLSSCGSGGSGDTAQQRGLPAAPCAAETEEPLDPGSGRHVLPGGTEPTYATDPPTSGPHQSGAHPTGDVDAPIPRPQQVALLEDGGVLIQYREPGFRSALAALAKGDVTIAPNPELPGAVVATAWQHKLVCSGPNPGELATFIAAHTGKGAGGH